MNVMQSASFALNVEFDPENLPKLTKKNIKSIESQIKFMLEDLRLEYNTLKDDDIPDYPKISVYLKHHD